MMPLITIGYGLLSASVACLNAGQLTSGIAAIFCLGIGLGFIIPATNMMVAEINPERSASSLNLLNLVWGLGALLCPPLVSLFSQRGYLSWFPFGLALLLALISLGFARELRISRTYKNAQPAPENPSLLQSWMKPYSLLTGLLIFIYVGIETSVGGWLASYAQRLGSSAQYYWALTPSLFWTGLLLGRAVAPAALKYLSERALVLIGSIGAAAGLWIVLISRELAPVTVGAFISGIGLAPVFPTTLAIFTKYFGSSARYIAGVLFVFAALGAAVIPWIVGITSSHYGELRAGLSIPLIGTVVMISLQVAIIFFLVKKEDAGRRC